MAAPEDLATLSLRAEARRESILAAALEIVSREGFHRTSIADIAARAHASRAAVYPNADARRVLRQARGVDRQADDAMRRIAPRIVGVLTQDVQTALEHGWARPCDAHPDVLAAAVQRQRSPPH